MNTCGYGLGCLSSQCGGRLTRCSLKRVFCWCSSLHKHSPGCYGPIFNSWGTRGPLLVRSLSKITQLLSYGAVCLCACSSAHQTCAFPVWLLRSRQGGGSHARSSEETTDQIRAFERLSQVISSGKVCGGFLARAQCPFKWNQIQTAALLTSQPNFPSSPSGSPMRLTEQMLEYFA